MMRMDLKSKAREILKIKIWDYWKAMLILLFLSMLLGMGSGLLFKESLSAIGFFPSLLSLVIVAPLAAGITNYLLKMVRGEEYDINGLFIWYGKVLPIIGLSFLISFLVGLGFVLLIIPGVIISFALSQSMLIYADGEEDIIECLRKSSEIMRGHKFDYFVLQLSFILWYLLGAVTFGIAYVYVIPYVHITNILFYESIKN